MSLIIKPINAMLTKDMDLFGKMDPYVVCQISGEKKRTKTHQGGGKNPQWQDTLVFQSRGPVMTVQVYDDDFGKDDFIGEGSVNLNQLYNNPNRTENQYIDLVRKGRSSGRVLISMEYQGPPQGGGWGGNNGGWGGGGNNGGWGGNSNWGPPNNGGWGGNNGPNNNWGPNNGGWGNGPNNGGWGGNGPNNGGWGNGPNNGGWGGNGPNNGGWGNGPNNGWGNNGPNNGGWGNGPNNGWRGNNGW